MDWMNSTNWYALQTKPFRENLAAAEVAKLDVEVFLPQLRQEQLIFGVNRTVIKPLFNGYFFAQFCPLILLDSVRYARGVLRVVGTRDFPIPLEEDVILAIRARIEDDGFIRLRSPSFKPGDRVCIEGGPWQGTIGRIEQELNDGKRVAILLEAIHHARLLIEKQRLSAVVDSV